MFLIFSLAFHFNLFAASTPKTIACFNQVTTGIDALGVVENWKSISDGRSGKIPGFGSVELHLKEKKTHLVFRGEKSVAEYTFEEPACEPAVVKAPVQKGSFSDLDLLHEMFTHPQGGVVTIWSPHMALSVTEVKSLSTDLGFPFKVLLEPKASEQFAKEIAKKENLPEQYLQRAQSRMLFKADALIHYPTTVFYKNYQIIKRIPGYNGKALRKIASETLK